jgi:predicted Zn-dependent protease
MLSESEARSILNKVLALSQADECQVALSGGRAGNLRFARNAVSTAGGSDTLSLSISSSLGAKTGSVTVNELDDASLAKAVRAAEELARLSPDNPEHMPLVGPQRSAEPKAFFTSTAGITQADRVPLGG